MSAYNEAGAHSRFTIESGDPHLVGYVRNWVLRRSVTVTGLRADVLRELYARCERADEAHAAAGEAVERADRRNMDEFRKLYDASLAAWRDLCNARNRYSELAEGTIAMMDRETDNESEEA